MTDAANMTGRVTSRRVIQFPSTPATSLSYAGWSQRGERCQAEPCITKRFTGPHRLLQARRDSAFKLGTPAHLRVSRTLNVSEFERDQVDRVRQQSPPVRASRTRQAECEMGRIVGWREWDGVAEFEVRWLAYRDDRQNAEITRDTTLQHLLFIQKGASMLQDPIQMTKVSTGQWLLQGSSEREEED